MDGPVSSQPGPMEPKGTFQWVLLRCGQGLPWREVGSSRSGQVYSAGAECFWCLGHSRAGRRARPENTGPCPGGPANDPRIPAYMGRELAEGRPISWNPPNAHTSEWRGEKGKVEKELIIAFIRAGGLMGPARGQLGLH